jgi:hypothetical protein
MVEAQLQVFHAHGTVCWHVKADHTGSCWFMYNTCAVRQARANHCQLALMPRVSDADVACPQAALAPSSASWMCLLVAADSQPVRPCIVWGGAHQAFSAEETRPLATRAMAAMFRGL